MVQSSEFIDQRPSKAVRFSVLSMNYELSTVNQDAPIAQLDRAPDFESVGREFESPWARHFSSEFMVHSLENRENQAEEIRLFLCEL